MIINKTNGRLDEIRTYAKENNLEESFNNAFAILEHASKTGYEVTLGADFAPLSLTFSITNNGELVLNGGMIFHGPHDGYGSGGAPTFSVSTSSNKKVGWSIHT